MSQHTPEPWTPIKDGNPENKNEAWHLEGRNGDLVTYGHMSEQDARRIVACVNACTGIETEKLESLSELTPMLFHEWLNSADPVHDEAVRQRDELLAALKQYVESWCDCMACKTSRAAIAKVEGAA